MTAPEERWSGVRSAVRLIAAALSLSVLAMLVGSADWPAPRRTSSGWQVADVPVPLLTLLLVTAVVSLAVAVVLARAHRLGATVTATWWAVAAAATFALIWNDLYLTALGDGPIIPVFAWAFTFVPTLLVGLVARRGGRAVHLRATLGLAVLLLPLSALGWPLASDSRALIAFFGGIYTVALFGVLPLVLAVVLTRAPRAQVTPVG
ncbi:hypothetical protein O2V63_07430 [Modestobacter sp. VKM Ac-2977]|uniref:hypothetical protein n=1 Tax=Modestobacter sp. VKM Ac-2977 TaxID=3004131 RepID=UPI0022AAFCA9|nr:hypothetical protein [Modestobacter sp. VKM Ac-2977]MCZ2820154.1 hypothetical protein [Modestobacter sp. VKM Ac-2977]